MRYNHAVHIQCLVATSTEMGSSEVMNLHFEQSSSSNHAKQLVNTKELFLLNQMDNAG